jgi:ketosteroid isomerase-like protein
MARRWLAGAWMGALVLGGLMTGAAAQTPDLDALRRQVEAAERAFAKSMADRDLAAFERHLSEGTIFYGRGVLRGKAAVVAAWKGFYEGPTPPFSWEPDQVDVTPDGTLAMSTGPVRDPAGKRVSRFNTIWRQEAPGVWRVLFDKGQPLTESDKQQPDAR